MSARKTKGHLGDGLPNENSQTAPSILRSAKTRVKENEILTAALSYAARGWRVFPIHAVRQDGSCECAESDCEKQGKHPAIKGWPKEATTDEAKIREWWGGRPDWGVGIATGESSGLTVLDVDGPEGSEELSKLQAGTAMPSTPTVQSRPGRYHFYFSYEPGVKSQAKKLGNKLDTRGDGGYVVTVPSRHASGGLYVWLTPPGKADLAPWPEFLRPGGASEKKKPGRPSKEKFNPAMPADVEKLRSALECIDPDDEERWSQVGWIMGRAFRQSDEGFAVYRPWAARSRKFNAKRTKEHYYKGSEAPREQVLTTAAIYRWAQEAGWVAPTLAEDGDHHKLALATIEAITQESGAPPVYALGAFWVVEDALWQAKTVDNLALDVARRFAGGKYCKRGSDFNSVAKLACTLAEDESFFTGAAVGVAAPGGFWRVTEAGEIKREPLTAEHRQRMRVAADPDDEGKPTLLLKVVSDAFHGHEPDEQTRLLQQVFGCAITRSLWRHMVAVLLLGVTKSGKSTLLKLLTSVFPRDQVGATSPQRWGDEYYVAALAGMAVNVVGELDKKEPIPGGAFKNTVGRDIIQGRHPTHRPFTFVCQAAHFFNANHTPPTTDHSDAFFNRWRVLHFANVVPPAERILDLDQRLISEETGAFLWWALEGAAKVAQTSRIIETETSTKLLQKWRVQNNSALAFLFDEGECKFDPDKNEAGQALYRRYKSWAADAGHHAFGRSGFYDALTEGAGEAGIRVTTKQNQITVEGVRLKTPDRDKPSEDEPH